MGGIGEAVMKRGSERDINPPTFFAGGIVYGIAYATLGGVILLTIALVDVELFPYPPMLVATAFVLFVIQIFYHLSLDTYRSYGKTGYAGLTDNVLGILETGLQVLLLFAGFGVFGLLVGTTVMTALVTVALLIFSTIDIGRPSVDILCSIWRYGRWSVVTSGLTNIYSRLPLLLIGAFLGNDVAGYYTSADRLLVLGSHVGSSIAPALMVRASASRSNDDDLSDLRVSMRYGTVLALPMLFGSLALSNTLMITVFGPTFAGTGPVLIALAVYHVVNTYDTVIFSFFNGIGYPENSTKATAMSLAILAAGCIITVVEVGLLGVVVIVVIAHIFHFLVGEAMLRGIFGRVVFSTSAVRQLFSSIIMFIFVSVLAHYIDITGWLPLLIIVGTGAAVYSAVILVLDKYLRGMVQTILSSVLSMISLGTRNT